MEYNDIEITIVKIGGNVIDCPEDLKYFLQEFAVIPGDKVLVHGGGKLATRISAKLDVPTKMIDGRRVTDSQTIEIVTMVYAGLINKSLTAQLRSLGCDAIGLSGIDAGIIEAVKRSPCPVDFGFVGDIPVDGINAERLLTFINAGLVPVFCSITADRHGILLNCNADTVAQSIATALSAAGVSVRLIYCFEKQGLLANVNDDSSVIPLINSVNCEKLKASGVIAAGMIPKIDNAFKALNEGVKEVVIKSHNDLNNTNKGTKITLR
ncbi:MAG: acetylglutamate kinase [Prevotellaceae bacterium]|jgi:acetylglutamate kinase|nr:acetylglutamate kinase [Prevotellaceae bacterium]